ncbi:MULTISPECIES: hypothetical protein [Flavobacterium]|uniref:Uncharacterized protein n=2 Tax=Flavobacterium TaxID=237 RepID=A0ABW8PL87_9FLAO|nr:MULTISPECIES: hypothetical protein [Flavobacterium]QYS88501.1 hypothetical protein JJC05_12725 [Flavobacterium davisii]
MGDVLEFEEKQSGIDFQCGIWVKIETAAIYFNSCCTKNASYTTSL